MKKIALIGTVVLLVFSASAVAEIEKIAMPSAKGFDFSWWPKIAPPGGWHHDRGSSLKYGVNAMAPDGFAFSDAESVMYANANYKPRIPKTTSLEILIADDKKTFLESDPNISITEVSPCTTADGKRFRSFTFFPKEDGNWERVTYGEEGEFFLIFTLSARSKGGFDKAVTAYESMIKGYREKP